MDRLRVFCVLLTLTVYFSCGEEELPIQDEEAGNYSGLSRSRRGLVLSALPDEALIFGCNTYFAFIAGQSIDVGSIKISTTEEDISVTFTTREGWMIRQTHLYIGTEADIPLNNGGNPQIGHFNFQATHDPQVDSFTYVVARDELEYDNTLDCAHGLVIATHAEVILKDEAGSAIHEETAWGRGNKEFPGERWGWYFMGCALEDPVVEVTGGGNICEGETAHVTFAFTGEEPFSFVYTNGNGDTILVEDTGPVYELEVSQSGTYSVVSFADAGNCTVSAPEGSAEVEIHPLPGVISASGNDHVVCTSDDDPFNDTVDLTFTFSGAAPFTGEINDLPFNSETEIFTYSAGAGVYSINSLTDAHGCEAQILGEEVQVTEECDDDGDNDDGEDDGDDDGDEDDGGDEGDDNDGDDNDGGGDEDETDNCGIDHSYDDGYCRRHANAFAFGDYNASCFPRFGFPRWGWTNLINEGSYTWDIYADAGSCNPHWGVVVGTLEVEYFNGTATITYNLTDPDVSWGALNAWIGYTPTPIVYGYPTINPRKYPHYSDGCTKVTFTCPGLRGPIFIIAHAEVVY